MGEGGRGGRLRKISIRELCYGPRYMMMRQAGEVEVICVEAATYSIRVLSHSQAFGGTLLPDIVVDLAMGLINHKYISK